MLAKHFSLDGTVQAPGNPFYFTSSDCSGSAYVGRALLHELLKGPRRDITRIRGGRHPRVGSHREGAPGIEGRAHLCWIECQNVIADVDVVGNTDDLEPIA
jgi:hypothetical protein